MVDNHVKSIVGAKIRFFCRQTSGVVIDSREGRLDAALDAEHFAKGFFVTVRDLKLVPSRPVLGKCTGIGHLGAVCQNTTSPVQFLHGCFHLAKVQTELCGRFVTELADGLLVNITGGRQPEVLGSLGNKQLVGCVPLIVGDLLTHDPVDPKSPLRQAVLFLEPSVQSTKLGNVFRRASLETP